MCEPVPVSRSSRPHPGSKFRFSKLGDFGPVNGSTITLGVVGPQFVYDSLGKGPPIPRVPQFLVVAYSNVSSL